MDATASAVPAPGPPPHAHRPPWWALPAVVIGIVVIVAAGVVALRGLVADPIVATDAHGIVSIRGSFEPYPCPSDLPRCSQGYVQAGSRGVFVRFPDGCPIPTREAPVAVRGRPAADLGPKSYRGLSCAAPAP